MMDLLFFTLNVVVALLAGVVLGLERQFRGHPAGLRTNALVCVGAALFVSLFPWKTLVNPLLPPRPWPCSRSAAGRCRAPDRSD
jgi:hypothetical protein